MMEKKINLIIIILIVLFSLIRFININSSIGPYWQSQLNSYVSFQIANGEMPYKDFILVYPPVAHYVTALFMLIFSKSLLSAFILNNLIAILSIILTYLIARRFFSTQQSLICALILSIMPIFSENAFYLETFALFFTLLAVYFLLKETNLSIFISGVSFSLAYFSKQIAGLLMIGACIYLIYKKRFRYLGLFILGQILFTLLLSIYLFKVTGYNFIDQILYQLYSPLNRPFYFLSVLNILQVLMHPLYLISIAGLTYSLFNLKKVTDLEKLSLFMSVIFFIFVFLKANLVSEYFFIIVLPFMIFPSIRFFDFKHETLKYVLILILVYSIILGPLFALGKQLTFLPEKHNEIITTADYIRAITSEEDRILGDNNAVAFYSNRKKAGNIYDSSRAYMYAKVKIISDQDKIDIIKNKKPLVVYIYDSRYDFLEKMDFFNEFYSKINQIGDYRVYKLNA